MFISHITFKTLKHTQVLRLKHQHNKIHQITKLPQLSTTTTTILITNSSIHDTQCINSSTTHVKTTTTTTTTFEHEFINNSTTTTSFIINFIQKHIMFISTHFDIQIQQQQQHN
jgi:hypothetical protein